jgi:hypothetical protein
MLALFACHRTSGGASDSGAEGAIVGSPRPAAAFAQPIAAARVKTGTVMVAGLAPSRGVIAVENLGDDGAARWTVDVLSGISGGPNVELHVFPTTDGAAVVYRGRKGERQVTQAALVDASGRVSGPAFDAGPAACATDDALAWIERPSGGAARVLALPWGKTTPAEILSVPAERDPALVCGTKTAFALGDGERDTTIATRATAMVPTPQGSPGASPRPRVIIRDRDFTDEEREHDTFVVGDALGLVRVGQSGSLSLREVGAEPSPWRHLGTKLTEADDVVAVDGDSEATTVVFTHDDGGGGCDGPSAPGVRTLRVSRKSPLDASFELAPAACGRELGPFWTGSVGEAFVVAWVERASVRGSGEPPIVGFSYRTITSAGLGELRRVARPSDEMVDAGCDKDRCYAVALVRPPQAAEPQAESVEVLAYP